MKKVKFIIKPVFFFGYGFYSIKNKQRGNFNGN